MSEIVKIRPIKKIPAQVLELLGEPPLWHGESRAQYDAVLLEIAASVAPTDFVGWLSVAEVTYHVAEHRRLRELQAATIKNAQIGIIEDLLKTTCDLNGPESDVNYYISGAKNDARRWAADPEFAKIIDGRLASRGHDRASILAKAYVKCASAMQLLSDAICDREHRRMTTLREIDRRDEILARGLKAASHKLIDVEFSEAAE